MLKNIYKKIVLLLMIMCYYTCAFSSQNYDASPFITRAEFDSYKNKYDDVLSKYYSSIDITIDAAIASYLAGLLPDTDWRYRDIDETSLTYPLTISRNNIFNKNRNEHYSSLPLWLPKYNFYCTHNRMYYYCFFQLNYNPTNQLHEFLNYNDTCVLTSNGSSATYAIINDIYDNYTSSYTCFNAVVDHRKNHASEQQFSYNSNIIFGAASDSQEILYSASPQVFPWATIASKNLNNSQPLSWNTAVTYDTVAASTQPTVITDAGASVAFNSTNFWSIQSGLCNQNSKWITNYDRKGINKIYNDTGIYVPCCENGILHLTNYPKAGVELMSSAQAFTAANTTNSTGYNSITWSVQSVIMPPYSIMDSDYAISKNASTPFNNQFKTSVIKSDNLCYSIHDVRSGVEKNQIMTQGIYLTTLSNKDSDSKMEIKVTAPANTYLFMRTSPIIGNDYSSSENVLLTDESGTQRRYVTLKNGSEQINTFTFHINMPDLKTLYYKIYSSDINSEVKIIEPPKLLVRYNSLY